MDRNVLLLCLCSKGEKKNSCHGARGKKKGESEM